MGMYNEVFYPCPENCGGYGYLQIHQIVLGFGGFYLDTRTQFCSESVIDLSNEDLLELKEAVVDELFTCEVCKNSFIPYPGKKKDSNNNLIEELFG